VRFTPDVVFARVVAGRLGRVKTLACHAGWPRNRAYYARNDWAGKLRCGDTWVLDGPATNALAHQITNLLFLASSEPNRLATPMSVRAELYAAGEVESHDTAAIEIRTAEGPAAYFLASHCSEANFGPIIEIEAERGKVLWTTRDGAKITYTHGHPPDVPRSACPTVSSPPARTDTAGQASRGTAGSATESCPAADGRDKMVANFIEAVRANDPSLLRCPLSETRAFVLALDAAHESSRSIHRISPDHTRQVGDGAEARTIVSGLDDLLARAAANRQLFSGPAGRPPWVTATEAFPLAGYTIFPQRFGLE
jgi:predicted dehydrogenase